MNGRKLKNTDALKFIFAGKSIVTFLNTKTGNRFTFKTKAAKDSNMFFVSVLNGPDLNKTLLYTKPWRPENWTYIGTCIEGKFRHGRKSNISADAQSVKVFDFVLAKLVLGTLPEFVEVWHEGHCGKCGRVLTVPKNINLGIGPECIKSLSKQEKRDEFLSLILG
jgi:hypothetical protein